MQCPACRTTLPDGARFCNVCGALIPQEKACGQCGRPVKPGQKFCMICGAPVTIAPTATGPVSAHPTAPAPRRLEPAQIVPPASAAAQAPPGQRGRGWLWLVPVALIAALIVTAVALDLPGKLSEGAAARGTPIAGTPETSASPQALWRQAQERQAAGAWDEVPALLTQLRAADPAGTQGGESYQAAEVSALLATACTNLARQAEQAPDPDVASTHWACVLQERPGDAEATAGKGRADLYLAGQAALVAGQYPQAIAAWDELQRTAAGYADVADRLYLAYVAYGEALCATGAPEDAQRGREQLELARSLTPERSEAAGKLAACQLPMPTSMPTATPLPGPHLGVIADDVTTLRVRSGPGAGYFVLGKLTARDAVTITGRTADAAWVQIEASPERAGWVSSEYVKANYPTEGAPVVAAPPLPQRLLAAQEAGAGPWQLGRLWLGLGETLLAAEQPAGALEAFESGLAATQAAGPDYLWGLLAAESAIALARLEQRATAEARLAAAQERAGADPRLAGLLAFARAEVTWDAAKPYAGELAYRQAALACSGTPLIADVELRLAERLAECGCRRRAAFAWDAARHDGYLTGNRRAHITALLRGGAYLLERGEVAQGRKLLTQAVEAGARHGYDDLAADALVLLGQESEAQALRNRAAVETVKTWWPALALRLGLAGPNDRRARPWPTAEPDPAGARVGVALAQVILGQITDGEHTPEPAEPRSKRPTS